MATTIISPDQVYSKDNVYQANTNPIQMPSDLLGIRDAVYSKYGINELQNQANQAYQALSQFNQNTASQINQVSDALLSMNKISGIQNKISRDRGIEAQGLASAYDALSNNLNAKYNLANNEFNLLQKEYDEKKNLMLQYPDAGIKITDTWDKVQKRIQDYNKQLKKQAQKAELQKTLSQYGVNTKKLSSKEMEKKLNKILAEEYGYKKQLQNIDLETKLLTLQKLKEKPVASAKSSAKTTEQPALVVDKSDASIKRLIQEAVNSGDSWGEIVQVLQAYGIDTKTGSLADRLLNQMFNNQ